ncbi:MFS transporter [Nocardia goodfellowii]|uniref:MFS transporter n=1 Tax=Nocardia goodfellowii TaxID=882446 RepID=A0ABS4Q8T8_9NOCA|nr:MFS transporter [Nocardia goodfellowii]MBP2187523.1 putative MFS transporter [Nocardia goodfellowii]
MSVGGRTTAPGRFAAFASCSLSGGFGEEALITTVIDDAPFTGFHARLAIACSGGPLLDGYILSIVGTALIGMTDELDLSTADISLIGASALIGMFIGGALFGVLTDKIGREVMYTADLVVMALCSVLSFWTESVWLIVILRFVLGMAVAADYPIATSLLSEWLPRKHRGTLLGFQIVAWYLGSVLAYVVGYFCLTFFGNGSWRWQLASGAVLCVFFLIIRQTTAPESPRWLAQHGRENEAAHMIEKYLGEKVAPAELIEPSEAQHQGSIRELFTPAFRKRTIFCCGFFLCQVAVLFAMLTFGPRILESFGMPKGTWMDTLGVALISLVFLIGCLPAMRLINTVGRRPTIVWCFGLMIIPVLAIGIWPSMPMLLAFVMLCLYAFFCGGPNVLDWTYPNELFPTHIRATAVGFATSISRVGAALGTFLLPWSLDNLGTSTTFLCAAAVTALGFLICLWGAPETKGRDLTAASAVIQIKPKLPRVPRATGGELL